MGGGLFLAACFFISQVAFGQAEGSSEQSSQGTLAEHADEPIFENDPLSAIVPQPNSQKFSVHLRFVSHGLKIKPEILNRLIETTEKIYNSCPGIDFKIVNEGVISTSKTRLQEGITTSVNGKLFVTNNFFNFFGPASNSKPSGVIDIHLVDFLTDDAREQAKKGEFISQRFEGQGFSNLTQAFKDSRPSAEQYPPLSFFEDNIVIAHDLIKKTDGQYGRLYAAGSGSLPNQPHKYSRVWRSYSNYLLAHELGHILMDRLTPQGYKDHFCPGTGAYCTRAFLMSAGGFNYDVFYNPKKQKNVVGFGPIPQIDAQQCENLKVHPLVTREDISTVLSH